MPCVSNIALSVVKKYAETLYIGLSWKFSQKAVLGFKRGPLTLGTCPSNVIFVITCLTCVPNVKKIRQILWSLSWTKVCADRKAYTQVILYLSNAMNCIGQTNKFYVK